METSSVPKEPPGWFRETKVFEKPSLARATWQLVNTLGLLVIGLGLMIGLFRTGVPYGIILLLGIPTGLLVVRLFIIFHDCTHGSFFESARANTVWGTVLGFVLLTSYRDWRKSHAIHHATNGNLDRRGVGDVWTMTLAEYRAAPKLKRLWYRVYRSPFVMFLIAPAVLFLVLNRIPHKGASASDRHGTWATTTLVVAWVLTLGFGLGWDLVIAVFLPVYYFAWVSGVWLFYVQHQFDPGYWAHEDDWDPISAAMDGSSHYKLPKILQWFSGNIGLHHIHHLRPKIPNYNLERCYRAVHELQMPKPLTIGRSIKAVSLNVWDEQQHLLITFREAARLV